MVTRRRPSWTEVGTVGRDRVSSSVRLGTRSGVKKNPSHPGKDIAKTILRRRCPSGLGKVGGHGSGAGNCRGWERLKRRGE